VEGQKNTFNYLQMQENQPNLTSQENQEGSNIEFNEDKKTISSRQVFESMFRNSTRNEVGKKDILKPWGSRELSDFSRMPIERGYECFEYSMRPIKKVDEEFEDKMETMGSMYWGDMAGHRTNTTQLRTYYAQNKMPMKPVRFTEVHENFYGEILVVQHRKDEVAQGDCNECLQHVWQKMHDRPLDAIPQEFWETPILANALSAGINSAFFQAFDDTLFERNKDFDIFLNRVSRYHMAFGLRNMKRMLNANDWKRMCLAYFFMDEAKTCLEHLKWVAGHRRPIKGSFMQHLSSIRIHNLEDDARWTVWTPTLGFQESPDQYSPIQIEEKCFNSCAKKVNISTASGPCTFQCNTLASEDSGYIRNFACHPDELFYYDAKGWRKVFTVVSISKSLKMYADDFRKSDESALQNANIALLLKFRHKMKWTKRQIDIWAKSKHTGQAYFELLQTISLKSDDCIDIIGSSRHFGTSRHPLELTSFLEHVSMVYFTQVIKGDNRRFVFHGTSDSDEILDRYDISVDVDQTHTVFYKSGDFMEMKGFGTKISIDTKKHRLILPPEFAF